MTKFKNQKGLAPIVGIIIAVVILAMATGGTWYYKKNKQAIKSVTREVTGGKIDITSWQLFSNQIFDLRYPIDSIPSLSETNRQGFKINFKSDNRIGGYIDFRVKSEISPNNLEDYEKHWENLDKSLGGEMFNKQQTIIDGHKALQYDFKYISKQNEITYYGSIYIDFGDYLIHGNIYGPDKSVIEIIHAIYKNLKLKNGKFEKPKMASSLDASTWKIFNNNFFAFSFPNDWKLADGATRGLNIVSLGNPNSDVSLVFSVIKRSELRNNGVDYYEITKNFYGSVSNEREIRIDNLTARAFDKVDVFGNKTISLLFTQNYIYEFDASPNINDVFISKIVSTIKIKLK